MGTNKLAKNDQGEYINESKSLKGLLYLYNMGCRALSVYCKSTSATTGSAPLYGGDLVLDWLGEKMSIEREHGSTTLMGPYAGHFRLVVFNPPDEDYLVRGLSAAHNCHVVRVKHCTTTAPPGVDSTTLVEDIGLSVADAAVLIVEKVEPAALALATTGSTTFSGDGGVVPLKRPAFKRYDPCRISKDQMQKVSDFHLS
jgi:hypothetical protein